MGHQADYNDLTALLKSVLKAKRCHANRKLLVRYQIDAAMQHTQLKFRRISAMIAYVYTAKIPDLKHVECLNPFLDPMRTELVKCFLPSGDGDCLVAFPPDHEKSIELELKEIEDAGHQFNFRLIPDPGKYLLFARKSKNNKVKKGCLKQFFTIKRPPSFKPGTKEEPDMTGHRHPIYLLKDKGDDYNFMKCLTRNLMVPIAPDISIKAIRDDKSKAEFERQAGHTMTSSSRLIVKSGRSIASASVRLKSEHLLEKDKDELGPSKRDLQLPFTIDDTINGEKNSPLDEARINAIRTPKNNEDMSSLNRSGVSLKSRIANMNAFVKFDRLNKKIQQDKSSNMESPTYKAQPKDRSILAQRDFKVNIMKYMTMIRRGDSGDHLPQKTPALGQVGVAKSCLRDIVQLNNTINTKYRVDNKSFKQVPAVQDKSPIDKIDSKRENFSSVNESFKFKPIPPIAEKVQTAERQKSSSQIGGDTTPLSIIKKTSGAGDTTPLSIMKKTSIAGDITPMKQEADHQNDSKKMRSLHYLVHRPKTENELSAIDLSKADVSAHFNESFEMSSIVPDKKEISIAEHSENIFDTDRAQTPLSNIRTSPNKQGSRANQKRAKFKDQRNSRYYTSYTHGHPQRLQSYLMDAAKNSEHLNI